MIDDVPRAEEHLRGDVAGRPARVGRVGRRRRALAVDDDRALLVDLREAPVGEVDLPVIADEDVLRLDVAVQDPARVRVPQGARDLEEHAGEARGRPRPAQLRAREDVAERALLHDAHRVEGRAVGAGAEIVDGDDAGVLELRGDPRLLDEARGDHGILRDAGLERLQRHHAAHLAIERGDDLAHAAGAELLLEGVARADEAPRHRLHARRRERAVVRLRQGDRVGARGEELLGALRRERGEELARAEGAAGGEEADGRVPDVLGRDQASGRGLHGQPARVVDLHRSRPCTGRDVTASAGKREPSTRSPRSARCSRGRPSRRGGPPASRRPRSLRCRRPRSCGTGRRE